MSFYLAFDTSSPLGSVAVSHGGDVLAREYLVQQGQHAANLVPRIAQVLDEAGVDRRELAGIVVGSGPGSFTGVRVSAATAKGLVFALGIPLWAFSSLAAAAVTAGALPPMPDDVWEGSRADGTHGLLSVRPALPLSERPRYVLFDARGDRLYAACYSLGEGGLETVVDPYATELGELLEGPVPERAVFLGDGAARHQWDIQDAGFDVISLPEGIPTADGLIRLLAVGAGSEEDGGSVDNPSRWEPHYLRPSNAERESQGNSGTGHRG